MARRPGLAKKAAVIAGVAVPAASAIFWLGGLHRTVHDLDRRVAELEKLGRQCERLDIQLRALACSQEGRSFDYAALTCRGVASP